MNEEYQKFLASPGDQRRYSFDQVAVRLGTLGSYIEKDFFVCLVLDVIYNGLPEHHPQLLFKGGTSLSKAFDLIQRFSEDIDIVVERKELGFDADRDPTIANGISNKERKRLFEKLQISCSNYVTGPLADALASVLGETFRIEPDDSDGNRQTLLIEYPTLYGDQSRRSAYVLPSVKLELGARSAFEPSTTAAVKPYVLDDLAPDWSLRVGNLHVIQPTRTFLDKLMILHGLYCGCRDTGRLPPDGARISRHYYDVAMITDTEVGNHALADDPLLADVREHNRIAFASAWRKYEEAVRGTIRLVPQSELRAVLEKDYDAMQQMIFGDVPEFNWVMERIEIAEEAINRF